MTLAERDWGNGYTIDVAYLPGYYRQQSPSHLNLACLLGGVAGIDLSPTSPLSYLELGCGYGFSALVLAAANPRLASDRHRLQSGSHRGRPDARCRGGNRQCEVHRGRSRCDDRRRVGCRHSRVADVVALHGLWSWVGDGARNGIVRLLGSRLRPGGLIYISYNALPRWGAALGMQRLLREAGSRLATRSDRQAAAGLDIVRTLAEADARQLRDPFVRSLIEAGRHARPAYLAHEFMNAAWRPTFHADVVLALRAAKLDSDRFRRLAREFFAAHAPRRSESLSSTASTSR